MKGHGSGVEPVYLLLHGSLSLMQQPWWSHLCQVEWEGFPSRVSNALDLGYYRKSVKLRAQVRGSKLCKISTSTKQPPSIDTAGIESEHFNKKILMAQHRGTRRSSKSPTLQTPSAIIITKNVTQIWYKENHMDPAGSSKDLDHNNTPHYHHISTLNNGFPWVMSLSSTSYSWHSHSHIPAMSL